MSYVPGIFVTQRCKISLSFLKQLDVIKLGNEYTCKQFFTIQANGIEASCNLFRFLEVCESAVGGKFK